jgi:hypothetical protein
VKVELADWEVLPDGEHRFHPAGSLAGSCGARVVVEPAAARVEGAAAIPFRVSFPGAARERCRIMVWFRTDDIDLDDGEGTTLVVRTGVKVHVEPGPPG